MRNMARRSVWVKVLVFAAVLAVLVFLFLRSVRTTRTAPFVVERGMLTGWTLAARPGGDAATAWLGLGAPERLAPPLGREIFGRTAESLAFPSEPVIPLLLQAEFDAAFDGPGMPDTILRLARDAGLESGVWTPRCMGYRRISEPGGTRSVYFLLFEGTRFERFRDRLADLLRAEGRDASRFDPRGLSPVLMVAGGDGDFGRWIPLRADPATDCLAPVEVE